VGEFTHEFAGYYSSDSCRKGNFTALPPPWGETLPPPRRLPG